jgi:UDP-glucose 4-epimerase
MKILILGGNGFIGSNLVDKLLFEGHNVRVFDKSKENYRKELSEVDYHYGDFGNRVLLSKVLEDIDVVIHLISTTLPKTSNDDPIFDINSNVIETLFLLKQCVNYNVKKIVFTSSGGTIYGVPEFNPIIESHPTNPICSYGISKLAIEKYLFFFKEIHNLDYVILRPSNPYGIRQNPRGIQGAITVFLSKILKNEPINVWGDGNVVRDYIYIEDLVNAIYSSIICKTNSKIFNIGSGQGYSLKEILLLMKKVTGRDILITYSSPRKYDIAEIYLDITRAENELNWKPTTSLEYGINKTMDFIKTINKN